MLTTRLCVETHGLEDSATHHRGWGSDGDSVIMAITITVVIQKSLEDLAGYDTLKGSKGRVCVFTSPSARSEFNSCL